MKTKIQKIVAPASMTFTLLAAPFAIPTANAALTSPQNYVALGDSVAAGVTPYQSMDAGYTDIIAHKLAQEDLLIHFSKDFAVPGFSTTNILELLENEQVRQGIEQATLITLSAGANDVLGLVRQDAAGQSVSFEQLPADFALNQMRIQYGQILDEITSINPTASLYTMGYFFPYPNVLDTQKDGVTKMLNTVNEIIKKESIKRGIPFIPVSEAFGVDAINYLPNPTNVHPNQAGYVAIANAFFNEVEPDLSVTEADIPPNPGISPFLAQFMPRGDR
ncbi:GDSL-type esterase/lipase family protein [Jeotgalibacillus soli]|uniref:SGNH hydrolase-type esterase domain-containing protein n=1 Tax=Jeotgalibacillus soli TaxID=889306 RepID=A0A0C2VLI4_9BACL|nr:GDSL-type esterase/lipase family protein [Jeotgalibacillus soli]KIL45326.1 hypothetical protein KP78_28700 [Jeotgalibacillus soli]